MHTNNTMKDLFGNTVSIESYYEYETPDETKRDIGATAISGQLTLEF